MRRALLLAVSVLLLASPAAADDVGVTGQVRPGSLALVRVAIHAGGASLLVRDSRGSGKGWKLTMTRADAAAIRVRCAVGSTCTLPRPGAVKSDDAIVVAARGSGMGSVQVLVVLERRSARPAFRLLAR